MINILSQEALFAVSNSGKIILVSKITKPLIIDADGLSALKDKTDIVVGYDHEYSSNTIPLPATTIYTLSDKLAQNRGIKNVAFME